jgi:hypothetical protein
MVVIIIFGFMSFVVSEIVLFFRVLFLGRTRGLTSHHPPVAIFPNALLLSTNST